MKTITIDINKQENIELKLYPDNQPHIKLPYIPEDAHITVNCSILNSIYLINLLQVSDALDTAMANKMELHIPYLMAARFDRIMENGDSFDLRIVAKLINSMNFRKVFLYDVHSDVASALINNAILVNNDALVKTYTTPNSVLICPDAGAAKKISRYIEINKNITDISYCIKHRDLSTGKLDLRILEPSVCESRDCVIIDDLCDGGGTFLAIASQIKTKSLTLIVTHGLFTKGFVELEKCFDKIITSDTYHSNYNSKIVEVVSWMNF